MAPLTITLKIIYRQEKYIIRYTVIEYLYKHQVAQDSRFYRIIEPRHRWLGSDCGRVFVEPSVGGRSARPAEGLNSISEYPPRPSCCHKDVALLRLRL